MKNSATHIDWTTGPLPDTPGNYLIWLSKPMTGSQLQVARVAKSANGNPFVTIGGYFAWDILTGGRQVVAWSLVGDDLKPMEE